MKQVQMFVDNGEVILRDIDGITYLLESKDIEVGGLSSVQATLVELSEEDEKRLPTL